LAVNGQQLAKNVNVTANCQLKTVTGP